MSISIEDAERLKELIVTPTVEALKSELESHFKPFADKQEAQQKTLESHAQDIQGLKATSKKALLGWGVYATGFGIAWGSAWGWIRSKFHWG